jgi:signal transduction histidine kinase
MAMAATKQPSPDQFEKLRSWLASLPSQIDYDRAEGVVSRQEFLRHVCSDISAKAVSAVYLRDSKDDASHLTLAYAYGAPGKGRRLPRVLKLEPAAVMAKATLSYDESFFLEFALEHELYEIQYFVLREGPQSDPLKLLHEDDLGLAVVFLPDTALLTPVALTQLRIAWRLFTIETVRSRFRRKSMATSAMLDALHKGATEDQLCEVLGKYCRALTVYMYERNGDDYAVKAPTAKRSSSQKLPVRSFNSSSLPPQINSVGTLRSHAFGGNLPKEMQALVGKSPWMLIPCLTDGLDILNAEKSSHPQYLLMLIGKESTEYLGGEFSLTDANIASTLVSLLSGHVPYMGLAEKFSQIHEALDARPLGRFDLKWFCSLAQKYIPALWGIGIFPDFPGRDGATYYPSSFHVLRDTIKESRWPRPFELCTGLDNTDEVSCMVFRIATEYRSEQRIVFAFHGRYIPEPTMQILNILVEHIRSEAHVEDFRDHHISTQAQIRHVIRGSLAAAISEIELVESRVSLYANMPTKLIRLFETPTMKDGMTNTLQWLNEASALVEAPRYLLESFDGTQVRWSDVKPVAVVRSVLAICRAEMRRRGLRVEFTPSVKDETHEVSADPEFIKIAIFNIIDNAVKYSYQDRHLGIAVIFSELSWRFEVENIGVPIRREDRKKIFSPFVRSSQYFLANRRPGTGLGLAVSRRILEAHDENAIFDCDSDPISDKPPTARTTFFFQLGLKGKGEASV